MIKVVKVLLIVFWANVLFADNYFVIQLKGGILNKTNGKILKMGDKIDHEDQLKFLSSDAAAILMSTKRGRFVVRPNITKGDENELIVYVKNVLMPVKTSGNLSTRGGEDEAVMDLKSYFGASKFAILGDKFSVKLNTATYPIDNAKFFIYRYEYGGKPISKKIPSEGDKIIFDKNLLYSNASGTIPSENVEKVDLYFFDSNTKSSALITQLNPVYLSENQVKEELKVQYDIFISQSLTKEEIYKELSTYVNDIYGKTDMAMLKKIVDSLDSK